MTDSKKTPDRRTSAGRAAARRAAEAKALAARQARRQKPAARADAQAQPAAAQPVAGVIAPAGDITVAIQRAPTPAVTSALITVAALTAELGAAHSAIQKRARAIGAAKMGKTFLLTAAQADQIRAEWRNPNKRGPKPRAIAQAEAE